MNCESVFTRHEGNTNILVNGFPMMKPVSTHLRQYFVGRVEQVEICIKVCDAAQANIKNKIDSNQANLGVQVDKRHDNISQLECQFVDLFVSNEQAMS